MRTQNLSLTLLMGLLGAICIGYVVQNTTLLGSPVQVLTLVGVIYLILKDLLVTLAGGGNHAGD
jgi:hypothetical protein